MVEHTPQKLVPNLSEKGIATLIEEGYLMLHYVARHGELTIEPQIASGIQQAKSKLGTRQWTAEEETQLLQSYDKLAKQIYPVTLESIQAVDMKYHRGNKVASGASKVIVWYRRYTVVTLLCLLCVQMYYLFGFALTQSLAQYTQTDIEASLQQNANQQANYELLKRWNQIWLIGQTLSLDGTDLDEPNVIYSANIIAAHSVLQMLQSYILPLLYGLLGAFIFVLRSLLLQVRSLTYTASREIGYRLRLTLGCLAGMIIGWVLKPEMGEMTLSPMALAFLAGYSIEVLFTLLDRLIDQVRQQSHSTTSTGRVPD